ncbi:MAG: GIY-YIG nuclease family protein [Nanoarchaeota archaeon]|nr:GIY-YIG nuclease family protein [Nanoarchaeota archaeon]
MRYFVYILRSLKNSDIYVGSTNKLDERIALHNGGKVKSTKGYMPWILLEVREFKSRSEAVKHERFLKTGQQKEILKRRYNLA